LAAYRDFSFSGALAVTAAALPAVLQTGINSQPVALTNAPALPGRGDGSLAFTAPPGGAGFAPVSVIMTQDLDAALAGTLGLTPGGEGTVFVTCFDAAGARLGRGAARLPAGQANRVSFPPECRGAARVVIAPVISSTRVVIDDLEYYDLGARRR
jgi:hypothetical protein